MSLKLNEHHSTNLEAKNTAALFTAQFVVLILALVLSIFSARNLGAVVSCKYSFALAFTAIFAVSSSSDTASYESREVAWAKSVAGKYLKLLHDKWNTSWFHRHCFSSIKFM